MNNEKALSRLAKDLVPLNVSKWKELGVNEETIDSLLDAQRMRGYIEKERQLRLVRARLRDGDWMLVRRRIDTLAAGFALGGAPESASSDCLRWTEQMLIQGDSGLARFCEEFEDADRQRLRQMIRNVQRAPDNKREKSRSQLERAVESTMKRDESS